MTNIIKNSRAMQMQEILKVRESLKNFKMSLRTVIARKDFYTSKETCSITAIEIAAGNDDKNRKAINVDVIPMDKSCFNANASINVDMTYVLVDGVKKSYELYTSDFIQITVDPVLVDEFKGKSFYYSPATGGLFVRSTGRFEGYKNIAKNQISKKLPLDTVEYDPRLGVVTAGTLKKSCFYCHKVAGKSYIDFVNEKVNGAFSKVKEIFTDAGKVMKFLTRPGISITGQNPIFDLDCFAVVDDLSGYDVKGKGLGKMDGIALFIASIVKEFFRLNTIAEALGVHFQCRTDSEIVSKIQGIPSVTLVETLDSQESYKIYTKDGQPRELNQVQAIFDMNGIKAMGLEIDEVKSINGFYKFDKVTINVMSISKLTEGKMSKQGAEPVIVAAAEKGPEALSQVGDFFLDNFERMLAGKANDLTRAEAFAPPLSCNYIMEVVKSCVPFAPLGLRTIKEQYMNTFATVINKMGVTITDDKGRNCMYNVVICPDLSLSLTDTGIIPKGHVLIGKFSKDLALIENEFGRDSKEYAEYEAYCGIVIGFKYPKMHFQEFLDAKVMNMNDVVELINSRTDLSADTKRKLIFQYTNMCDAAMMLPDDKDLMKKCAGLDFDWDKMTILFPSNYQFITDLLFGKSLLVNIKTDTVKESKPKDKPVDGRGKIFESSRKKDNKVTIPMDKEVILDINNKDFFWSAFSYAAKNLGNIGQITNWNNIIIGIRIELLRGNSVPAEKFLKEVFGKKKGGNKEVYHVDDKNVDIIFVDNMLEEMNNCKWTKENILNFLNDCCKVFRLYQEGTIDGAKTGIYLFIRLSCSTIKAASLLPISAVQVEEDGVMITRIKRTPYRERTIKVKRKINGKDVEESMKTHLMYDFIAELQDKMINLVETVFETFFDEIKDDFAWKQRDIEFIGNVLDHASLKYTSVVAKLRTLNGSYISSLGEMLNAKNKVLASNKYEDKQLEKKLAGIEETFNLKVRVLSSTANRIMADVKEDMEYKGALALGISMLKGGGINAKSSNRFGISMFPAEVYSFILGQETSSIRCEGKILQYGNETVGVGDSIDVILGASTKGFVINEKFTGTVTIDENDIAYAYKPLEELGVVGGYDENSYSIVLRANDVDKNMEEDFMGSINSESALHVTKKDVYFSKDLNSEFESIAVGKNTNVLTDVELGVDYSVKSAFAVELYLGDKDETGSTVKTRCYIVELQK